MLVSGVLPSLRECSIVERILESNNTELAILYKQKQNDNFSGQFTLLNRMFRLNIECEKLRLYLYILFDGIEGLVTRDLELGLLAARDFNYHVGDSLLLIYPEGNIMEGRYYIISFL